MSRRNGDPKRLERLIAKPPKRLSEGAVNDRIRSTTHRQTRKWLEAHLIAQKSRCFYCRDIITRDTATLDHVVPLSRQGLHHESNTVAACERCNTLKDNLLVPDFMPLLEAEKAREKEAARLYWIERNRKEAGDA